MLMLLACGCGRHADFGPNIHYDRIRGPTIGGGMFGRGFPDSGITMHAEAGIGGGELSLGYGSMTPLNYWWLWKGIVPKVSVLRTWGDPNYAEAGQTYLGAGIDFMYGIYLSASYYWHIGCNDDEHDRIWSLTAGIGF